MVIQEAMRLFPPTTFVSREALERTQIGHIVVPKGVCMCTLIPKLHRDPDIWGHDAHKFRPERFINSVCNTPHAYIPFGVASRSCFGHNFAMAQLKVIISLITCKFNFSLSPNYQHAPAYGMIVQPGHGVMIEQMKKPLILGQIEFVVRIILIWGWKKKECLLCATRLMTRGIVDGKYKIIFSF